MKAKLTKRDVEALEPGEQQTKVWDTDCPGLLLVVHPGGSKSYAYDYRSPDGRRRRLKLGRHPAISPTRARDLARQKQAMVDAGRDPLEEKQRRRTAPTIADLTEKFIAEHGAKRKAATVREYRLELGRIADHLGPKTPVDAVTWEDVADLHAAVTEDAPVRANRCLSVGGVAWTFARKLGWWPRNHPNPWRDHEKNDEGRPGRALDRGELEKVGAALAADSSLAARGLELVLLSGARPGELRTAKWEQLDGRLLRLAAAKTGPRSVFMGAAAVELVENLPHLGDHLIESPAGGAFYGWSAAWSRARKESGVECRSYDLRHTFVSTAAALGIHTDDVRALVGHAPGREAHRRYLHPESHPDLRDRLLFEADRVSAHLSAALRGELPAKGEVVAFPGVRG